MIALNAATDPGSRVQVGLAGQNSLDFSTALDLPLAKTFLKEVVTGKSWEKGARDRYDRTWYPQSQALLVRG
jgi:hypothetical protein